MRLGLFVWHGRVGNGGHWCIPGLLFVGRLTLQSVCYGNKILLFMAVSLGDIVHMFMSELVHTVAMPKFLIA
jgi:hypothetical protein